MEDKEEYVQVGEHEYKLPPRPKKSKILFNDLPKSEQYWRRSEVIKDIPSFFFDWHRGVDENARTTKYEGPALVSLSIEDTDTVKRFREREIDRMLDGIWFYNNGEPVYLTGGHYGYLTWCKLYDCLNDVEVGSEYGCYVKFQRTYCYFIEICKTTKVAKGGNVVKPKKTGITMLQELLMLVDAITHRSATYSIMSTKEDKAVDPNMKYILYAVRRLPEVLKPEYRNNLSAVYFEDTGRGAKSGGKSKISAEPLECVIQTVPTVWNGFDGSKQRVAHIDEQSKIKLDKNYDLTVLHNNAIATVMQGTIRVGYVIYTHYVSDTNDKSFRLAKQIYYDGKLKTINEDTGTTKSELICLALTILDGIFGQCDRYGEPNIPGILKYVRGLAEAKKDDPNALRSHRRQMPETEEECWVEGAGEASIFDNLRLGLKLGELMEDMSVGQRPYMDFNFAWTASPVIDEIRSVYSFPGIPKIVPVTHAEKMAQKDHGLWKWYKPEWTPQGFLEKHTGKLMRDQKGMLMPNPGSPFYMSIDPTQYSGTKDVSLGSKNAMHVFLLPCPELDGMFNKKVSNKRLLCEYHHRAENPRDTLMHVVQTILYFGCYVLIECNANWLATRLKEWGLANFLIRVNEETKVLEPYNQYVKQKPFTSQRSERGSADTIGEYIAAGMMHINDYESMDNIEALYSSDVIKDLMNFEPENTRQYDSGVCYLIGLLGIEVYLGWRQRAMEKAKFTSDSTFRLTAFGLIH